MTSKILIGDVREQLRKLPEASVDCVVTSPPYWGLRDYGVDGQIGLERTLGEHLDVMVGVFREVWRVMKPTATLWLNYGDCYAASPNGRSAADVKAAGNDDRTFRDKPMSTVGPIYDPNYATPRGQFYGTQIGANGAGPRRIDSGGRVVAGGMLKAKDLCMVPNRLAIALQEDGWWVRSEIIWSKPNPMPETVYDRPATAHEKIFLLTKSETYFYDAEAIKEPVSGTANPRTSKNGTSRNRDRLPGVTPKSAGEDSNIRAKGSFHASTTALVETRNARNVWTIASQPFKGAHFATFPVSLAERCITAGVPLTVCGCCGAPSGCGGLCEVYPRRPGVVLDPFGGSGTVGVAAERLQRDSILIELNPEYAAMAEARIAGRPIPPTTDSQPEAAHA